MPVLSTIQIFPLDLVHGFYAEFAGLHGEKFMAAGSRKGIESLDVESKEAIAERLEIARIALDYSTQQAFAASVHLTPSKWNNYVSARDRIPLNVALELCKKHRLSLDWIYRADPTGLPLALARRIDDVSTRVERSPRQPHRRQTKPK